jgi:hypothetical protein
MIARPLAWKRWAKARLSELIELLRLWYARL